MNSILAVYSFSTSHQLPHPPSPICLALPFFQTTLNAFPSENLSVNHRHLSHWATVRTQELWFQLWHSLRMSFDCSVPVSSPVKWESWIKCPQTFHFWVSSTGSRKGVITIPESHIAQLCLWLCSLTANTGAGHLRHPGSRYQDPFSPSPL